MKNGQCSRGRRCPFGRRSKAGGLSRPGWRPRGRRASRWRQRRPARAAAQGAGRAGIPPARRPRPAARMFFAALMSRSCSVPQTLHRHPLIPRPATPFGPVMLPQHEQVWVEYASLTSSNHTPASSHLYCSMVRNALQPASNTNFAIRVFARPAAFTSPMKIAPYSLMSWVLSLCSASLRRFAILA